jgi:hypothetical protein
MRGLWNTVHDAELAADWSVPDGENPNLLYGSVHPFCYYNERTALTLARLKTLSDRMRHELAKLLPPYPQDPKKTLSS